MNCGLDFNQAFLTHTLGNFVEPKCKKVVCFQFIWELLRRTECGYIPIGIKYRHSDTYGDVERQKMDETFRKKAQLFPPSFHYLTALTTLCAVITVEAYRSIRTSNNAK